MTIQFTNKMLFGDQSKHDFHLAEIAKELDHYQSHIIRIEARVTDEIGARDNKNDIRCLVEAWLEGRKPMAVTNKAHTIERAVSGATDKLKTVLHVILEH